MHFDGFDWDKGNILKVTKHGLSLEDVEKFFTQGVLVFEDSKHSEVEPRSIAVGAIGSQNKLVFVAFTIRVRDFKVLIRPISARFMRKKEMDAYEKFKKKSLQKK
jgi:uncharacterized DUF497 family protein